MKKIITGDNAREDLIAGVNLVADSVKITLGPSGRNAIIRTVGTTEPFTSKDGATIAKEMWSQNAVQMVAIECLRSVSVQSERDAGDGTTSAAVLAQAMFNKFQQDLKESKNQSSYNTVKYKEGMVYAANMIAKEIEKHAVHISIDKDEQRFHDIAMVSTNHDSELSRLVVDSFKASGDNGIVNIQRTKKKESYLDVIEGITMPISMRKAAFVNNKEKDICEFDDSLVLLTNHKINNIEDGFGDILQICSVTNTPITIICDDMHDDVMEWIVGNVATKRLQAVVIRALGYGKEQADVLVDLSSYIGKEAFLEENSKHWKDIEWLLERTTEERKLEKKDEEEFVKEYYTRCLENLLKHLPKVKAVSVNTKSTSIKTYPRTKKQQAMLDNRLNHISKLIEERPEEQEYEISMLKQRRSRINSGISYINLVANSELEYIEKQHRIEDALHSVKWAAKKGIIAGGGSLLQYLKHDLKIGTLKKLNGYQEKFAGAKCVIDSLDMVFKQILINGGVDYTKIENVIKKDAVTGFDMLQQKTGNMFELKIVDAAYVAISAVINSATIVGDIITTDLVIVDEEVYSKQRTLF